MAKKKIPGTKWYGYTGGKYARKQLASDRGCKTYRTKRLKGGKKLLVCIKRKKGPRGGRTKAVAELVPKNKAPKSVRKRLGKKKTR